MESVWDGARLAEIREAKGISPSELARQVKTSPANILRWELVENGVEPKATHIYALADALGVSCEAFRQAVGSPIKWLAGRKPK